MLKGKVFDFEPAFDCLNPIGPSAYNTVKITCEMSGGLIFEIHVLLSIRSESCMS